MLFILFQTGKKIGFWNFKMVNNDKSTREEEKLETKKNSTIWVETTSLAADMA